MDKMRTPVHNCQITSQISSAQDTIAILGSRIRAMEDSLEHPNLPEDKRAQIETELAEIKKLLDTNKEILSSLHKENSKSFAFAACLIFLCFLVYGFYCILSNNY